MTSVPGPLLEKYTEYSVHEWVSKVKSEGVLSSLPVSEMDAVINLIQQEQLFPFGPSVEEIRSFYVPFSAVIARRAGLYFDQHEQAHQPCFLLGVGGSVSVGKTTAARVLKTLLQPWLGSVEVVATDHFLLPNEQLEARGLMRRKGFPESYDRDAIKTFMESFRRGDAMLSTPLYDHVAYTRLMGQQRIINRPKCLILEGVSALQRVEWDLHAKIFFQAGESDLWQWYWERFLEFRRRAQNKPEAFFHRYSLMTEDEVWAIARDFWVNVNWVNMKQHIEPTRDSADWVITKNSDHKVQRFYERR